MLSIGQFSKICSVTKKTLHYYDEIGLIHPAHIGMNGYRYYDISQLKPMLFINRLKGYGFSLEEIQRILADESEGFLYRLLLEKEEELLRLVNEKEMLISRLQQDRLNLERGISIMNYVDAYEVKLVERKSENILFSRQEMSAEEYGRYIGGLFERVAKEGLTVTGPVMSIYHSDEFHPLKTDIELAVPVSERVKGTRDFPGGLHAMITHKGYYSDLSGAHARLTQWIEAEGYEIVNLPFELYMTDMTVNPSQAVTEVYYPVRKK